MAPTAVLLASGTRPPDHLSRFMSREFYHFRQAARIGKSHGTGTIHDRPRSAGTLEILGEGASAPAASVSRTILPEVHKINDVGGRVEGGRLPIPLLMVKFDRCPVPRRDRDHPSLPVSPSSSRGGRSVPLRDIDRNLIDRCLRKEPGAWNDFVDRYMGLIYHVIQHAAHARSRVLSSEDIEDIAAEIFLKIVDDDYGVLRRFKGTSSLPTYLTVIARRICIKELIRRHREEELGHTSAHRAAVDDGAGDEVEAIVSA